MLLIAGWKKERATVPIGAESERRGMGDRAGENFWLETGCW